MLEAEDDGFVSINLDSSRCDICQLDTGEDLIPCDICRQEISNAFMRTGFNELPTHADIQAHKGCLWKEHQILQTSPRHSPHPPGSPYICSSPVLGSPIRSKSNSIFDLMNGSPSGHYRSAPSSPRHRCVSQPATSFTPPPVQSPSSRRKFTTAGNSPVRSNPVSPAVGQKCRSSEELNKDAFNSKLRKLLRRAKKKELFENKRNDPGLSVRSSPGTRCPSPILISGVEEGTRCNSEKNLTAVQKDIDPRYLALKQSYAKYLFGKIVGSKSDVSKQKQTSTHLKVPVLRNTCTVDGVVTPDTEIKTRHLNNNNGSDNRTVSEELERKSRNYQDTSRDLKTPRDRAKESLLSMSTNQLRDKLEAMNSITKDISDELVDLLEERDELRHEVNMQHLTIEKLVQKEKAVRAACTDVKKRRIFLR